MLLLVVTKFAATAQTSHTKEDYSVAWLILQGEEGCRHNIVPSLFFVLAIATLHDSSTPSHSVKYKLQGFTAVRKMRAHESVLHYRSVLS